MVYHELERKCHVPGHVTKQDSRCDLAKTRVNALLMKEVTTTWFETELECDSCKQSMPENLAVDHGVKEILKVYV